MTASHCKPISVTTLIAAISSAIFVTSGPQRRWRSQPIDPTSITERRGKQTAASTQIAATVIGLFVCLSVFLFVCLSADLLGCLPVRRSICGFPAVSHSLFTPVQLSDCMLFCSLVVRCTAASAFSWPRTIFWWQPATSRLSIASKRPREVTEITEPAGQPAS
jgi:hypothetical protein